jgi:hypothetical protein
MQFSATSRILFAFLAMMRSLEAQRDLPAAA